MDKLHALNTCLSHDKHKTAPGEVLPRVAAVIAYTLECFQRFFLLLPAEMTEQAFFDTYIPQYRDHKDMLRAWTNYHDPS